LRAMPLRSRKAILKLLLGERHHLVVVDGIAG
jgi:hypothetical protein